MNVKKYLAYSIVCLVTWFHGSQAVEAQQNNGFFIISSLSGKCIDVDGAPGTVNGGRLQLFDCELSGFNPFNGSSTDQRWEFVGGGFIRNTLSGRCIDVDGAPGTGNGAPLQLFDCESSGFNRNNGSRTDQTWRLF
ncbi:MAG TPA: RICIN domain-containing protein [Nostoc sp.]|uniref:RICIN domain-containing protein n=1 Tax=Nostoc sp. TaxID=1180 RepID=UPI002D2A322E|nr:RICIN domain-containing protein [Nostoc sp.]HYX17025.1 RICIN domain-containing protein [Nostoc sp.]